MCKFFWDALQDDPLSALDVEVAAHVLDVGIRKLLAHRTVILVTHHLPVLNYAHHVRKIILPDSRAPLRYSALFPYHFPFQIVAMDTGQIRIQGSLPEIKDRDPDLASHWYDLISKKEAELARHLEAKTAKDRWTLLKLVSKIGFRAKRRDQEDAEGRERMSQHFRSRKGTFSMTYKNLSHDFFLPTDECHEDLLTPILRRRPLSRASRDSRTSASSTKHVTLQRMSSLQPAESRSGTKNAANSKFIRLQSMPAPDEEALPPPPSPRRFRSENNRLHEPFLKRLLTLGGPKCV